MVNKAKAYFLGKDAERLDCAQSVLAAAKNVFNLPDDMSSKLGRLAAGKAPLGYCGGLYGALSVLELVDKARIDECKAFFEERAGALTCKKIRVLKKASCVECVGFAAEYLEKIMKR